MRTFLASLSVCLFFVPAAPAQLPQELKGHKDLVHGVAFSPDGKQIATAGFDNDVKLWSFPAGKEVRTLTGHTKPVYSVAFSPDGKTLASGSDDKTIRLWNVATGKEQACWDGEAGAVYAVAFTPDGQSVAGACHGGLIRLWHIGSRRLRNGTRPDRRWLLQQSDLRALGCQHSVGKRAELCKSMVELSGWKSVPDKIG